MFLPAHTPCVHINFLPLIISLWILGRKSPALNLLFNATKADCITVLQLGSVMDRLLHNITSAKKMSSKHTDISESKPDVNSLTCHDLRYKTEKSVLCVICIGNAHIDFCMINVNPALYYISKQTARVFC